MGASPASTRSEGSPSARFPPRLRWMVPFAALGFVLLSFWFRSEWPRIAGGINDFLAFYTGARLIGSPQQFQAAAYLQEQLRATHWSAPALLYIRLPVFAFLLRPLGALPYFPAYLLWQSVSLAALVVSFRIGPVIDRGMLWCAACWSFPLFADLANGQDVTFLLLFLAVSWRLQASRPLLAGAVLGLCALKFHLFLLLPVMLIAQRRGRMVAGASITVGAILAGCFAVSGANWVPDYIHFVAQGRTNPDLRTMPNLRGLLEGLPHAGFWEIAVAVLVACAVGWVSAHADFSLGLCAAMLGGVLVSHHAYPADVLLLLPALLIVANRLTEVPVRLLCVLLLSPFPYLFTAQVPLASPVALLLVALLVTVTVSCITIARRQSVL